MKIMVNNCLSHEVDRLFKGAILERKVLYKNKVLYDIDIQDKALFECFMKHRHPKIVIEEGNDYIILSDGNRLEFNQAKE